MAELETPKTSRYNEASFNILRLHTSWTKIAIYRINASYDKWKWELDTIWSELCQDVDEARLGKDWKLIEAKNNLLRKAIGQGLKRNELYEALNARTVFLRRLQNRVGKGGSYDDGTSEDFE